MSYQEIVRKKQYFCVSLNFYMHSVLKYPEILFKARSSLGLPDAGYAAMALCIMFKMKSRLYPV